MGKEGRDREQSGWPGGGGCVQGEVAERHPWAGVTFCTSAVQELMASIDQLRRALEGREQQLGANHPSTLISVHNLAGLLQAQGKLSDAEPLYRRALEGREQQLGADHPSTLTSVHNLAVLLQAQGKLSEAEPLFRRAVEGREQQLGADHPDTLKSVSGLAGLLKAQGSTRAGSCACTIM